MKKKSNLSSIQYDFANKKILTTKSLKKDKDETRQKKCIIYARVSTEEQRDEGNGINGQIIDCEQRAKRNNVEIVGCFKDEAISGTDLTRPEFNKAIEFVESKNKNEKIIDYFVCSSTSRFSRNKDLGKNMGLITRLNQVGVEFVAVLNGGIQDLENEAGYLQYSMQSMMDALESMRGSSRVKYGIKGKLMTGRRPYAGIPAGYKRVIQNIDGKNEKVLIPDEVMFPILKEGLEQYALGGLMTNMDLFEFLEERGFKSNSKVNKTGKFYYSDIAKLLKPEKLLFYSGYLYNEEYMDCPEEGIHIPLIDKDIFDKLMRKISNKGPDFQKRKYDKNSEEFPLARILLCPECKKGMTKRESTSHTGKKHPYYGCNTKGCISYRISLARDKVHQDIKKRLDEIALSENLRPLLDKIFHEEIIARKGDLKKINNSKKAQIDGYKKEMEKIETMLEKINNDELFAKKQNERAELNEKVAQLEYSLEDENFDKAELERLYNDAKVVLFNPGLLWEHGSAEVKQLLIRVCFGGKIYYSKKQGCQTPEIPNLYLYFKSQRDSKKPLSGGAENRTPV